MKPFTSWTQSDVDTFNAKHTKAHALASEGDQELKRLAVDAELPLHNAIIKWCREQWPRVKYIHANPSTKSTIQKGCQDFTLFLPRGRVLCIECKDRHGKRSEDQQVWAKEMEMNQHPVHVVRSMEEFLRLCVAPNEGECETDA